MPNLKGRRPRRLTPEERKSLTHGDFWIPDEEREIYKRALEALNAVGVDYIIAGAYALYEHTGIYRKTKDLDLFFEPSSVVVAAHALREAGFVTRLEDSHWLAKATLGTHFVDLIYGMGNGVALIDREWITHSRPGILAATPVRFAPPEELIWHRLGCSRSAASWCCSPSFFTGCRRCFWLPRCPGDGPPPAPAIGSPPPGISRIHTIHEVQSIQRRNERFVVVDARSERNYEASDEIIPGSVRLHPDRAVADAERLEVPRDATIVVLCA